MPNNPYKVPDDKKTIGRVDRSEIILYGAHAVPFLLSFITGALNILSRSVTVAPPPSSPSRISCTITAS